MEWHQLTLVIFCFIGTPLVRSQDYRLPETVIPYKYEVDIFVPQGVFTGENRTFEGEVTMTFQVSASVSEIKLHYRAATIVEVSLSSLGAIIPISGTTYDNVTEIYTLTLENALSTGINYTLNIKYYNTFETTNMVGFYISTYKDENNQTSYLVLSKFEPVHARHAFPCVDEPTFKATFKLSLTYPTGLNALANTEIESKITVDSVYTKSTYQETTVMSTYLLAFEISKFTCSEGYTISNTVSHRVCSRSEESAHRNWALELGTSVIRTLESITGIKYGSYMPKMDQLAIPDFAAGAMENWGLVSYREAYLLWSEEDSSNSYRKSIALTVAHEFAHMWYGNLVTCKWWDYIFLNEGFARFYQYFAAAATKEALDWELEKHFNVEIVHTALLTDSSTDAPSLTSASLTPAQISAKFSTISYSKGAAILRMIEKNIMGADNFVYGLREYLKNYTQQATEPSDLWSTLAGHVPLTALPPGVTLNIALNNWVELAGHPVVYVTKSGNDIILTQERFLRSGKSTTTGTRYFVPVTYTISSDITTFSNTTVKSWLLPNSTLTLSNILNKSDWIILNNRQSGFYRVDYDATLWSAIKSQLQTNHLHIDVLNRAQLISDAYNFARSGSTASGYGNWSYADVLDVLSYLDHEQDYYPWYAAIVGNNHLLLRIGYESTVGQQFISWMLGLMKSVYSTVPLDIIDTSNQVYSMKQILILSRVCKYDESTCVSKAKQLFGDYRDNGIKVPKNFRAFVYCTALRHSDNATRDFNFLWQKYTESSLMTEVITMFSGLGCTNDTSLLKWYLGQSINSTSGIRLQDFTSVWSYVYSSSKTGTDAALEFIAENYSELVAKYSNVGTLISNAASYIYDEKQLEKLETLSKINGISASHNSTVQSAWSVAKSNIEWGAKVSADVKIYLDAQGTSGSVIYNSSLILVLVFLALQKVFVM